MDGVTFKQAGQYAMCCIENLSDELITALRDNLTRICHGADLGSRNMVIFKYEATLKSFWDRYSTKDLNTRTGMLGELLAHVIILKKTRQFRCGFSILQHGRKAHSKGFRPRSLRVHFQ